MRIRQSDRDQLHRQRNMLWRARTDARDVPRERSGRCGLRYAGGTVLPASGSLRHRKCQRHRRHLSVAQRGGVRLSDRPTCLRQRCFRSGALAGTHRGVPRKRWTSVGQTSEAEPRTIRPPGRSANSCSMLRGRLQQFSTYERQTERARAAASAVSVLLRHAGCLFAEPSRSKGNLGQCSILI